MHDILRTHSYLSWMIAVFNFHWQEKMTARQRLWTRDMRTTRGTGASAYFLEPASHPASEGGGVG